MITHVSNCCDAPNRAIDMETGIDYHDLGICPNCKEHCDWVDLTLESTPYKTEILEEWNL